MFCIGSLPELQRGNPVVDRLDAIVDVGIDRVEMCIRDSLGTAPLALVGSLRSPHGFAMREHLRLKHLETNY